MSTFQTGDEVAQIIGVYLTEIMADPDLGPTFAADDANVLMTYTSPDARLLLDCTANPRPWPWTPPTFDAADSSCRCRPTTPTSSGSSKDLADQLDP